MDHICPVCRQEVSYTRVRRNITSHLDSIGRDECPMTGFPFNLATTKPKDRQ